MNLYYVEVAFVGGDVRETPTPLNGTLSPNSGGQGTVEDTISTRKSAKRVPDCYNRSRAEIARSGIWWRISADNSSRSAGEIAVRPIRERLKCERSNVQMFWSAEAVSEAVVRMATK